MFKWAKRVSSLLLYLSLNPFCFLTPFTHYQIHVTKEEGTASVDKPFLFSVSFQKFVSGAVLNIAEVISLLSDHDTVKVKKEEKEVTDH